MIWPREVKAKQNFVVIDGLVQDCSISSALAMEGGTAVSHWAIDMLCYILYKFIFLVAKPYNNENYRVLRGLQRL